MSSSSLHDFPRWCSSFARPHASTGARLPRQISSTPPFGSSAASVARRVGRRRREPAVFRARRAHVRSRGPQAREAAGQREACRGRGCTRIGFERRAVERQSGSPAPRQSGCPPERHDPKGGSFRPRLSGRADRSPGVPELTVPVRSWPPPSPPVGPESAGTEVPRQGGTWTLVAPAHRAPRRVSGDCRSGCHPRDIAKVVVRTSGPSDGLRCRRTRLAAASIDGSAGWQRHPRGLPLRRFVESMQAPSPCIRRT